MGMAMEVQTMIVTNGKEERVDEQILKLVKTGYRLYPIDIPLTVTDTLKSEYRKEAEVKKVEWENGQTTIYYEITALHSTN